MDLEERIARMIDPDAWRLLDQHRKEHPDPDERTPSRFTIDSLIAAQRVIDGLHLDIISSRHSLDGLRHRYDITGFIREGE